jgi:hypothetical protein
VPGLENNRQLLLISFSFVLTIIYPDHLSKFQDPNEEHESSDRIEV